MKNAADCGDGSAASQMRADEIMISPLNRKSGIKIFFAVLASFVFSILYNGLVHLVILGQANKMTEPLRRPDFSSYLGLSITATLVSSALFTLIFALLVEKKNIKTGLLYGFCVGLFIAIMVDVNQYVLYPLPLALVVKWAFFGLVEFSLAGMLVAWIVRERNVDV